MTTEIVLVFIILIAVLVLFVTERLPADIVALLVLVVLVTVPVVKLDPAGGLVLAHYGLISTAEAFAGFASPAVLTVVAMFILSHGLVRAGVAYRIANGLRLVAGQNAVWLTLLVIIVVGAMSAVMNNIGATAILMPAVIAIGSQSGIAPSRLLIPLAFGSLLGGNLTLIGTPPNLLVSQALADGGHAPLQIFDYLPTGLAVLGAGVLYFAVAGRWLLPDRRSPIDPSAVRGLRRYLAELSVPEDSAFNGRTLAESGISERYGLQVVRIHSGAVSAAHDGGRGGARLASAGTLINRFPTRHDVLQVGDTVVVNGEQDDVMRLVQTEQMDLLEMADSDDPLTSGEVAMLEAVVVPGASFLHQTVVQADFRTRFGVSVLGIWRRGYALHTRLTEVPLEQGDVLLLRGPSERLAALAATEGLLPLGAVEPADTGLRRTLTAAGIMAGVVLLAALGVLHIAVSGLLGVIAMVVTGCVQPARLYHSVEWRAIFLIAGMLPLGTAMETTGTATFVADRLVEWTGSWGPLVVLAALYCVATLLTQVMSNAAATVLLAPVAITIAETLGVSPYPFAVALAIATSTAFMTPVGHQASILVYATGGYRFGDYTRAGAPLVLLLLTVSLVVVPLVWPF